MVNMQQIHKLIGKLKNILLESLSRRMCVNRVVPIIEPHHQCRIKYNVLR